MDQRGSYQTTHKKGLYHAPSLGALDSESEAGFIMFHMHTKSRGALSFRSDTSQGTGDVVVAMVSEEENTHSPSAVGSAVGQEVEMVEMKK